MKINFKQVKTYIGKNYRIFFNERGWKTFLFTAIITYIIVSVIEKNFFDMNSDVVYLNTTNSIFTLVCGLIWIGIFNSIYKVVGEREIVKREYRSGLNLSSYMLGHLLYDSVICFIESLIVFAIFITGLGSKIVSNGVLFSNKIEIFISIFLIIYSADIMGLMISSIVKTQNSAANVMPIAMIFQLVFADRIFQLSGVKQTISNFAISKKGMQLMAVIMNLNDLRYSERRSEYVASSKNMFSNWFSLIGFIIVYAVVGILFLKLIDKDKR